MASARDIRRRIKSVKSTAQITKAMQMVAASKMRRAQQAATAGRPYNHLMNRMIAEATAHAGDYVHPLMEPRDGNRAAVILVTSDKGLCGGLNSNILREASKLDQANTVFICAGRKGSQFVARTRRRLAAEFTYKDSPQFSEARAVAKFACDLFIKGEVDRVDVLYTDFINTLTQKPSMHTLLPVSEIHALSMDLAGEKKGTQLEEARAAEGTDFLFEPSAQHIFEAALPQYVNFKVYQLMLEARASEHSARMVAMKSATDNANGLIKSLTLQYNKMRQASITKELLEICSATMSLG